MRFLTKKRAKSSQDKWKGILFEFTSYPNGKINNLYSLIGYFYIKIYQQCGFCFAALEEAHPLTGTDACKAACALYKTTFCGYEKPERSQHELLIASILSRKITPKNLNREIRIVKRIIAGINNTIEVLGIN